ncbi:MAG: XylR N-terminal domain-containing protein [Bacteroidota bacterium]
MKALDFNMPKEIRFNFETGITEFKGSRLLIFDANVVGLQRQYLINMLGLEKAREFFYKLNYQNGYEEFINMKNTYQFDNDMELLASGPTIHTWRGIVQATPIDLKMNADKSEFYFRGKWTNSWEAQQHLMFNEASDEAVCWSLTGYAAGWCSAFTGTKCIAMEPVCMGKGDEHCEWLIKTEKEWGAEADVYREILKDF